MNDPVKRALALEAALPQSLNKDVVALLVGEENSEVLFDWLKAMPFVQERSDGWTYHDVVRPQMLRYQRKSSLEEWAQRHLRLADYYGERCQQLNLDDAAKHKDSDWQHYVLNQLYHRLCGCPQKELPIALSQFVQALEQKRKFAQQWAAVIRRAGSDAENINVKVLGKRLFDGLKAYDDKQYTQTITAFSWLLDTEKLGSSERSIVLARRGEAHRLDSAYESALGDFNRAIELDSEYKWAIADRGITYRLMNCYEEALTDFDCVIELDPEYKWAIANRGITYRSMERYEEALTDFDCVIKFNLKDKWTIANRGITYRSIERYEEALTDFDRAIELGSESDWMIANRGETYRLMERYEEALNDFNRAIELNSAYKLAIASRGMTYQLMERYEEAIIDFNRAIELDSEYKQAIAHRGEIYRLMKRYEEALIDFDRAIELDPEHKWAIAHRGDIYERLARYEEAIADYSRAIELNSNNVSALSMRGLIYLLSKQYEKGLNDLTAAILVEEHSSSYCCRALAYLRLGKVEDAKSDLTQAIRLAKKDYEKDPQQYRNTFNLGLYYLMARKPEQAKLYYKEAIESGAPLNTIHDVIDDLKRLLIIIPLHPYAKEMQNFLRHATSPRRAQ